MTIMRCDKVILSIQLSLYQINWIDIESNGNKATLNRLTMMLCDDSVAIESNRIASHRFKQGDVEPIDHEKHHGQSVQCHLDRIDTMQFGSIQLTHYHRKASWSIGSTSS